MLDVRKLALAAVAGAALVAGGAGAGGAAAQTVDGPKVNWKFSTWGPPRAQTAGIEKVAEIVKERTNGNFTIDIGFAEQYAPAREGLDSIKIGVIDGAQISGSYHPGKNPALNGLEMPFLPLGDHDVRIAVQEAYMQHPVLVKEMARWNAVFYASAILPAYEFFGVGEPPKALEDWKGRRVRALGGMGDAMRTLGAVPTTVPAPEVYNGLERGIFDAASFPYTYAHISYRLHEVSKWYTSNMALGAANVVEVLSKSSWDALPKQYQDLLIEVKGPHYDTLKAAFKKADDANMPMLKERGLIEVRYTDEQRAKLIEMGAQPVWDKWVAEATPKGVPAQELLDLIFETAKKASKS